MNNKVAFTNNNIFNVHWLATIWFWHFGISLSRYSHYTRHSNVAGVLQTLNAITCTAIMAVQPSGFFSIATCQKPQGPPSNFFLENALKKLLNIFSTFFFYFKVQSFWLIMENNFIQMAASVGHAVVYTISSIFKHIIDCVQLYFTNGFKNIVI